MGDLPSKSLEKTYVCDDCELFVRRICDECDMCDDCCECGGDQAA